jgi:hypothetical protein
MKLGTSRNHVSGAAGAVEAAVLIFPTLYSMTGGLILQYVTVISLGRKR